MPDVLTSSSFILSWKVKEKKENKRNKSFFLVFSNANKREISTRSFQCKRHNEMFNRRVLKKLQNCTIARMVVVCSSLVRYLFRYQWMHTRSCSKRASFCLKLSDISKKNWQFFFSDCFSLTHSNSWSSPTHFHLKALKTSMRLEK